MKVRISEKVAYETGVHIGDGNLYSKKRIHRVTYSGDLKNERGYYKKVLKPLLKSIYNREPRYYERKSDNTVLLIVNSRELVEFKNKVLNLPIGKKDNVSIPKQIKQNKKLLMNCMRGIGDTDFSLSFKKNRKGIHTEPRLELYSKSKKLIKDVENTLIKLGFTFSIETKNTKNYDGYMIRIYGKKNLQLWLKKIGFSNPSRLIKLTFWKKFGYFIPKKTYDYYAAKINLK